MPDCAGPRVRAAILAGGLARRLGGEKATVELAGRPLIAYPLEAASAARLDPLVVAKHHTPLPGFDCEVIREPDLPVHPLLGILTALEVCQGSVLALGCDMPFVSAPLLEWLAGREPPAVGAVNGHLEPLLGLYAPADAGTLAAALDEETSVREAVGRLDPKLVGDSELSRFGDPRQLVMSVNTKAELAQAARLMTR